MAAAPAMPDDVMAQLRPILRPEQCTDRDLDLVRIGFGCPSETSHQPPEVGVHGDAGNAERVAEYHVRGLSAHAWESHQVLHALRHVTAEVLGEGGTELDQCVGLDPEEAGGLDELF